MMEKESIGADLLTQTPEADPKTPEKEGSFKDYVVRSGLHEDKVTGLTHHRGYSITQTEQAGYSILLPSLVL